MTHSQVSSGWQLGEDSADAYERYIVVSIFNSCARRLVDAASLQSGQRVLDVGCGTGIVARHAAGSVGADGHVAGVDPNAGMLRVARRESAHIDPPIEWREGDATTLPYEHAVFDVAFAQQVLQFVPDPVGTLREMRRVLVPGGRLVLSVWRPLANIHAYLVLTEALERHVGAEAAKMMRSPFTTWDGEQLRDLVVSAGCSEVRRDLDIATVRFPSPAEFVRQAVTASPVAGLVDPSDHTGWNRLVETVTAGLSDYNCDEGVVFPMETHVIDCRD